MNIVPHSVSNYEFILQPNEWRIVFLFRNVWDKNVKYLQNNKCDDIDVENLLKKKRKTLDIDDDVDVENLLKKKRKFA